ncbi:DUF4112 domain-containing protein [Aestuariibacter salexigens]|uniref:DUF4112 domain-containing protein n=1 Tax=Aestuariibacter salexigens TaxID=226010 RepID=UPI000413373E|nr:DUF4112 domain-containing protein [Aestuariibacter salexigens]
MKEELFRAPDELLKAQYLANITDTAVRIPLLGVKVGLDFLIGLIPGVGDAIMLFVAFRIVQLGKRIGVPKPLLKKMVRNCLVDFGLGFIPVVGDLVDIFYKANRTNVRIMERWWVEQNKARLDAQTQQQLASWEVD